MTEEEQNALYQKKLNVYQGTIDQIFTREKNILELIRRDRTGAAYKKLALVDDMIYLSTLYAAKYQTQVVVVGGKQEDLLNEARKTLYKALIYLEEIVTNLIDAPFSDYQEQVAQIANVSQQQRYYLIRKMGLAIDSIISAYGTNTKWYWSFVELQARYATVAKNILDLANSSEIGLNPQADEYETVVYHLRLVKKLLLQAAERYREKYEMTSSSFEDFKLAVCYLHALRRVHLLLNERQDAEEVKKKAKVWSERMEKDQRKRDRSDK